MVMRRYWQKISPKFSFFPRFHGGNFDATNVPGLWGRYLRFVDSNPFQAAVGTSFSLWFVGDSVAQLIESRESAPGDAAKHKKSDPAATAQQHGSVPDWSRLFGTCIEGSAICGGLGLYWYAFLDRFVTNTLGLTGPSIPFVLAKVALECALWHPFTLTTFWTFVGWAEGHTTEQIQKELAKDFTPTLLTEYVLWLPIDILNFKFVPVHLQVLCVNVGCLVEAVLLSYIHSHGFPGATDPPPSQDVIRDVASRTPQLYLNFRPEKLHNFFVVCSTAHGEEVFDQIDVAHRGFITLEDLQKRAQQGGGRGKEKCGNISGVEDSALNNLVMEILLKYASVESKGQLSKREFLALLTALQESKYRASFLGEAIFSMFDVNGDGFIDSKELVGFLEVVVGVKKGTPDAAAKAARLMEQLDTDHDQKLSKQELMPFLKQTLS